MKILLANPRGFCAGVYMAIDVVDQLLEICPNETIFVFHEIVHNRHVVERFQHRGVIFVESIAAIPDGAIVVFSAHGVSPEIRLEAKSKRLATIDATCPLVTKVHAEAIRYARKGFQILLVGHRHHQEVVGTLGEAPDSMQVVECPADIASLVIHDPQKLVYLTQTTLSLDDATVIIDALKRAFPEIKEPPVSDICYATTNRQLAVRAIAPQCDLVLVVGSANSSNSVRLTEISMNCGTPARLIDDRSEIEPSWFVGVNTLLVTAGASAPEDLVHDLIEDLVHRYGAVVEQHDVCHEEVEFGLPGTLKSMMRERGIDPAGRRIVRGDDGARLRDWFADHKIPFRTVDLTVKGSSPAESAARD
ncbi:MAG: 4-hydroxy-3-methylbut-2-enyl diphosphate reductase [Phycisphaerales bacterium]|nr:4-hydroxy-3-methylbut-2-enyl diphosphate reductase [Phycisphaerales bacterium]